MAEVWREEHEEALREYRRAARRARLAAIRLRRALREHHLFDTAEELSVLFRPPSQGAAGAP